ncbi:MAG: aldehyde dehydrogenase family protein, partial [Gammaproteobacteria bacterium]
MHDLELNRGDWELLAESSRPPAGKAEVTAPFDGAHIATLETAGADHVEDALTAAYALYRDHDAWLPLHLRVEILEQAAQIMEQHKALLALEAAREGGKPLLDSQVEVTRAIDGMRICIEHIRSDAGEVIPMGTTAAGAGRAAFTQKEPIGVVVAVSAFNHPLNLIVHQVAAGIAAGCPVIVKPAKNTPLSCLRFVEILYAAGLPKAWCQVLITESSAVATQLVTDSRVGFFSFIGSPGVGWMLRSKLAPGTRCALEHGGAAPLLLAEDADLDLALPVIAKGGFYHAGQVCVSVQRVYAPRAMAADFARRLADIAEQLVIGDPIDEDTEVGPLISHAETKRVHEWVEAAVASGGQRICGGDPISDSLYPATVLLDPAADADVSCKEIFGPVVCVYSYDDLDTAIAQANNLPFSFQAAVFTSKLDTAMRAFKRLNASAVMVNDHTAFRVDGMPFAGLRESGLGVGGIPHTIND